MKISVLCPSIRPEGVEIVKQSFATQTFNLNEAELLIQMGDGKTHDLNAAFNCLLKKAKGELIVFWEDYTKATTNGLIKFWEAYQKEKDVFWTAPLGKTLDWKTINWDWRATQGLTDIQSNQWECDWAAAPLKALKEIGGFDEELDKAWSFDNVSVAKRAEFKGYKFKNIFDNPAVALDHDKVSEHPFRKNFDSLFSNEIIKGYTAETKLNYLT